MRRSRRERRDEKDARADVARVPIHAFVNPLLAALERALNTQEHECDPLLEFDFSAFEEDGVYTARDLGSGELLRMSAQVVGSIYEDVLTDASRHEEACVGPEDLRWLEMVRELA